MLTRWCAPHPQLHRVHTWLCTPAARRCAPSRSASTAPPPHPLSIVFFGTDDVSLPTLVALHDSLVGAGPHPHLVSALTVVTPGRRALGHGKSGLHPVASFAAAHHLPTHAIPSGLTRLSDWEGAPSPVGDVGVVVSFGYFLKPPLTSGLVKGAVNMHPSLLPRHRGAAPVPATLLAGDEVTGVTVQVLSPVAWDAGKVLKVVETPVRPGEGAGALTARLAQMGAPAVLDVLATWDASLAAGKEQDVSRVTRAPKPVPADGVVDWATWGMGRLSRTVAALDDTVGVQCSCVDARGRTRRVVLLRVDAGGVGGGALPPTAEPGSLAWDRGTGLWVRAADGWARILELRVDGKTVTGVDFRNGFPGVARLGSAVVEG